MENENEVKVSEGTENEVPTPNVNEKKFTQEDLNRLLAKEKEKGKKSVMKDLNIDDIEQFKAKILQYDEKISDLTKQINEFKSMNDKLKLEKTCTDNGVKSDVLNDFITLVSSKIDETTDIIKVIENMKNNPAYSSMFVSKVTNTGSNINPVPLVGGKPENYGQTLASKFKKQ